jgi:hypothetical protein
MDAPRPSPEQRDQFWLEYNQTGPRVSRCAWGGWWYFRYRVTRWWGIKTGLAVMQLVYMLAILAAVVGSVRAVLLKSQQTGDWEEALWTGVVLASAVVIAVYKSWAAGLDRHSPDELARRDIVASLSRRFFHHLPASIRFSETEARLKEICECVRRDLQEFRLLSPDDVDVVLLGLCSDFDPVTHTGHLEVWARDKARAGGWSDGRRAVLESLAYEAIRKRRAVAFHDLRSRRVRALFGKQKGSYRTLFCAPVTLPNETAPYAVLTVNAKIPYLLWPRATDKLDKRLTLFVELVNIFAGRDRWRPSHASPGTTQPAQPDAPGAPRAA